MAVALGKGREQGSVELQYGRGVDGVETIFFINRLPSNDGPLTVALLEEVIEATPAGDIDHHAVERRALEDVHLRLRNRTALADVARPPVQRVQDVHAALEPLFADADELRRGSLKPGRRHPAVRVPDGREAIPV